MRRRLKASWHKTTKPCDLPATVNDAAVQRKFMFLSGEICLTRDRSLTSEALVYKCLGFDESHQRQRANGCKPIAPLEETLTVIKQKSADGIVAKCPS